MRTVSIRGFEGFYTISENGEVTRLSRIRSKSKGAILREIVLKPRISKSKRRAYYEFI